MILSLIDMCLLYALYILHLYDYLSLLHTLLCFFDVLACIGRNVLLLLLLVVLLLLLIIIIIIIIIINVFTSYIFILFLLYFYLFCLKKFLCK